MTDPEHEGRHMNIAGTMSYGDYLHLGKVLSAQHPISDAHDEMLFIVQHQASEVWMKLAIHELTAARAAIAADDLPPAFKMLTRVARIFEQLNSAWDVLRTMTPSDYTTFRERLGGSSGFQSAQYRETEFILGNRVPEMLAPHAHTPDVHARLKAAIETPSLYDEALALLTRHGFALPTSVTRRPPSTQHAHNDHVEDAWRTVYQDPAAHWPLYELAEKLVDMEDYFRRWRFNHVTTVERVIGSKRGTGGTAGVTYLRRMLDVVLFPELWSVRTKL